MRDISAEAVYCIEGEEVWVYLNKDKDLYTVMAEGGAIGQIQAPAEAMDLYKQVYSMVETKDLDWLVSKVLPVLMAYLHSEPEDIDDIIRISNEIGWIDCAASHDLQLNEEEIAHYESLYNKYKDTK